MASFTDQSIDLDAGYLNCLENPTDACSIVCDAKEDILAIPIRRLPGICTKYEKQLNKIEG